MLSVCSPRKRFFTNMASSDRTRLGGLAAMTAYVSWGLFPIYFKTLSAVVPIDVIAWRIVLSFFVLIVLVIFWIKPEGILKPFTSARQMGLLIGSAILLSVNWYTFVYAIESNQVMQSSLGYFLVPIFSVGLGCLVFKERPNRFKLVAIIVACVGMCITFFVAGLLPWISLLLGFTFGIYGMFKKMAEYGSAVGLLLETAILMPIAIVFLGLVAEPIAGYSGTTLVFLSLLGLITVLPLLCMVFAARHIPLSSLGMFQYITPCMHLGLAILVYQEPLDTARLIALVTTLLAVSFWLLGNVRDASSSVKKLGAY